MLGGPRQARFVVLLFAATAIMRSAPARADQVGELTKMLSSSSSDKARLSAVTALARLGDKRALKPLVTALHDPNPQVRALAAAALGHLGHKAALPSLHAAATDDPDDTVRDRAREAASAVAKANHIAEDVPAADATPPTPEARHAGRAGFGHQAHAVADHPDLYVLINSSADDSPGKADKVARKAHADVVRESLAASFRAQPQVTQLKADAQRWGLDPRHIDLSVTKLEVSQTGPMIEVEAQLRLAISDDNGKMLSFLSGGAKVQVPRDKFDMRYLPNLRKEALENAMRGMFDKLLAHLRGGLQS